ncbi:MAG: succinate dehydrogenase/fumarate reductase iron-sulfur subunit [Xanthobacteraceae bacterium]|nr:succinate dehydrogenase/fumarate reductase iron-sulfur subunit [Xanthobacteraceae bacterium]
MSAATVHNEDRPQADVLTVQIWRGDRDGAFQTFEVPSRENQTVLDVVTEIQRVQDHTLSYRYACRVGMCGSCAMVVNEQPRWTCRTRVDRLGGGPLKLAPLRNLPIVKDLAVDMEPFFEKWKNAHGYFEPGENPPAEFAVIAPDSGEREAADDGIECINCGICYSACDVVSWNPDYLGPAALNRAWTLVNDVRDRGQDERLEAVSGDAGCHSCHSHMSCTEFCPKQLSPTFSIAGLKRATASTLWRRKP